MISRSWCLRTRVAAVSGNAFRHARRAVHRCARAPQFKTRLYRCRRRRPARRRRPDAPGRANAIRYRTHLNASTPLHAIEKCYLLQWLILCTHSCPPSFAPLTVKTKHFFDIFFVDRPPPSHTFKYISCNTRRAVQNLDRWLTTVNRGFRWFSILILISPLLCYAYCTYRSTRLRAFRFDEHFPKGPPSENITTIGGDLWPI